MACLALASVAAASSTKDWGYTDLSHFFDHQYHYPTYHKSTSHCHYHYEDHLIDVTESAQLLDHEIDHVREKCDSVEASLDGLSGQQTLVSDQV